MAPERGRRYDSWLRGRITALPKARTRHILYAITVTPGGQPTQPKPSTAYIVIGIMPEVFSPVAEAIPDREFCRGALLEKYARGREQTFEGVRSRGARALAA